MVPNPESRWVTPLLRLDTCRCAARLWSTTCTPATAQVRPQKHNCVLLEGNTLLLQTHLRSLASEGHPTLVSTCVGLFNPFQPVPPHNRRFACSTDTGR